MKLHKNDKEKAENIMQAFQMANDSLTESRSLDEMIDAYDKVVKFCSSSAECKKDRSVKRNTLLFWAYQNIAKAYEQKKLPSAAYMYLEKAVLTSTSDKQRANVLEKMIELIGKEDITVKERCEKILKTTELLANIYEKLGEQKDWERVLNLAARTAEILQKTGN